MHSKATFVTRLRPFRLPDRAARQLPDQSTTLWVDSSSTGDPRLRDALPLGDIPKTSDVAGSLAANFVAGHATSDILRCGVRSLLPTANFGLIKFLELSRSLAR